MIFYFEGLINLDHKGQNQNDIRQLNSSFLRDFQLINIIVSDGYILYLNAFKK